VTGIDVVRPEPQGLLVVFERFLKPTRFDQCEPQVVVSLRVIRFAPQSLLIMFDRLLRLAY
jgi:hypothetical protein